MSAKLLGLVSVGCLAAAAGGYLTLRPATPAAAQADPARPEPVVTASLTTPTVADAPPAPPPTTKSAATPKPVLPPMTVQPVTRTEAEPVRATPPASTPIETPVQAPPIEPPTASPPVPAAVEPPRYVPDAPVQAAAAVPEPQRIQLEELTVEKDSVIGIRLDEAISTRTARVEDRVSATVSRDVTVDGRTAIPAGVRLEGTVSVVERGGKFKDRSRLGLRFDRMILADGMRVPLKTDTIYREGDSPSADATAKVGASAVAGAILGAVLGGKKGAALGTAAGAVGGAAAVMRSDAGEVSLPEGAPLTVRLAEDVTVAIKR